MKARKFLLWARPKRARKTWPRVDGQPARVGVLKGGAGWVLGPGDPMTAAQIEDAQEEFADLVTASRFETEPTP